jgi:NAD(P)-dependent dehydrogenase (short-subunit alcohol dehydrogenase family)
MSVNLKGVWLMAQATARHIARLGHGGTIINIASILGLTARPQLVSYCASKAADIRVNALAPGYIETAINRDFLRSDAGQAMLAGIPQGHAGSPEDLDGALLLLASDASRFMTGSIIVVDGGHSAGL